MQKLRHLARPYQVWMTLLVVIPILVMLALALTDTQGVDFSDAHLSWESFGKIGQSIYMEAMWNSLVLSGAATAICLLIGYPVAYLISRMGPRRKWLALILLIVPMWSNMLLRIIAWEQLFKPNSLLNVMGISLDLIGTRTAIIIGMVSIYLPFMIFPIFTVLDKMDQSLIEAGRDLGAGDLQVFTKIIFPLSIGGVVSGIIMTFLPSATAFALPLRLGGGKILLIGNVIESLFKKAYNYNLGSLLSLLLMVLIFASMWLVSRVDEEGETLI